MLCNLSWGQTIKIYIKIPLSIVQNDVPGMPNNPSMFQKKQNCYYGGTTQKTAINQFTVPFHVSLIIKINSKPGQNLFITSNTHSILPMFNPIIL